MSWFKLHRSIFDNSIWENPHELRLFLLLISNAAYNEEGITIGDVHIRRGQYLRSYRKLQEDLSYKENNKRSSVSRGSIERLVNALVRKGMIQKCETPLGTLFTVVNYEKYQGNSNDFDSSENELGTGLGTDLGQTWDNTKKDKNDKNLKESKVKENFPEDVTSEDISDYQSYQNESVITLIQLSKEKAAKSSEDNKRFTEYCLQPDELKETVANNYLTGDELIKNNIVSRYGNKTVEYIKTHYAG